MMTATPRIRIADWRNLPADVVRGFLNGERDRWAPLEWDRSTLPDDLERGRQMGTVLGLVALNERNAVVGWTLFQTIDGVLQISALQATSESITALLLKQALTPQRLAFVTAISFFALSDAPGLTAALREQGLIVDRYWYLGRDLERSAPPSLPDVRKWRDEDLRAAADLCERSYDPRVPTRPFAATGRPEEWQHYFTRLTRGQGGGPLLPDASLCMPGGPSRLAALALVAKIGPTAAHLVQLVVDPQFRRRKIAWQLMELAASAAAQAGYKRMTLFVAGGNRPARALYENGRFRPISSFVAGGTLQPRQSTSVAPPAAVFVTRR